MNMWRQFFSHESAWAIIRRGIIVLGLAIVVCEIIETTLDVSTWTALLVPIIMTAVHLTGFYTGKKNHSANGNKY